MYVLLSIKPLFVKAIFEKKKTYEFRKLIFKRQKHYTTSNYSSCARNIYVLTARWLSIFDSPKYLYKTLPDRSTSLKVDVLQQVRAWISGQDLNFGFLITTYSDYGYANCVSDYTARLEIVMYK